jgi:hypothetical protein
VPRAFAARCGRGKILVQIRALFCVLVRGMKGYNGPGQPTEEIGPQMFFAPSWTGAART